MIEVLVERNDRPDKVHIDHRYSTLFYETHLFVEFRLAVAEVAWRRGCPCRPPLFAEHNQSRNR